MALRKICKCCKRKREVQHLEVIGYAHNNGRIWICKNGDQGFIGCKHFEWETLRTLYLEDKKRFFSDVEKRTEEHRKKLFGSWR